MRKLTSSVFAAALALMLPVTGNAQEAVQEQDAVQEEQEKCRATIEPIRAGDERVMATATFDAPFGEVTKVKVPQRSNLSLYIQRGGEREGMAAEGEGEQARELAAENQSVFWLKAGNAESGTYLVTLENDAGTRCTAELTVEGSDPISRDQDAGSNQEQDDTEQ